MYMYSRVQNKVSIIIPLHDHSTMFTMSVPFPFLTVFLLPSKNMMKTRSKNGKFHSRFLVSQMRQQCHALTKGPQTWRATETRSLPAPQTSRTIVTVACNVWGAERERVSVVRDVWGAWSTWRGSVSLWLTMSGGEGGSVSLWLVMSGGHGQRGKLMSQQNRTEHCTER